MYQDDKYRNDFFKVILRIIICFLIIILTLKLLSIIINNNKVNNDKTFENNLNKIQKKAEEYMDEIELPTITGDNKTVYLEELIKEKKLKVIKDSKGNECNSKLSYIKYIKLDNEYQIKSYLYCQNEQDYINKFIPIKNDNKETTTKVTTTTIKNSKKKNKKTTTKQKTFEVSYNTNGGNYIDSKYYKGKYKVENIIPVREGYVFDGWFYHGERFDFSNTLEQDIVLVAKWYK